MALNSFSFVHYEIILFFMIKSSTGREKLLNAEQMKAIAAGLDERQKFVAINGPKGSGKTKIAIELS